MSDTPRTDAMPTVYKYRSACNGLLYDKPPAGTCVALEYIPKDEARQLERELAAMTKERDAAGMALEFAKGAIADAIYSEDGLDGSTGESVLQIITEWQEHKTFDKTLCEPLTTLEQKLSAHIDQIEQEDRLDEDGSQYFIRVPRREYHNLTKERDALRADAERYRWLREGCNEKESAASRIAANCYGMEWDAAIDAAKGEG